jgi:hypothetical protein
VVGERKDPEARPGKTNPTCRSVRVGLRPFPWRNEPKQAVGGTWREKRTQRRPCPPWHRAGKNEPNVPIRPGRCAYALSEKRTHGVVGPLRKVGRLTRRKRPGGAPGKTNPTTPGNLVARGVIRPNLSDSRATLPDYRSPTPDHRAAIPSSQYHRGIVTGCSADPRRRAGRHPARSSDVVSHGPTRRGTHRANSATMGRAAETDDVRTGAPSLPPRQRFTDRCAKKVKLLRTALSSKTPVFRRIVGFSWWRLSVDTLGLAGGIHAPGRLRSSPATTGPAPAGNSA